MSTNQLPQSSIDRLRAFNRFWTARLGVLANLHQTPWSLGEARVIFELAQQPSLEVTQLREKLALDAGYLSRILAGFKRRKLVQVGKSRADERRHIARLTAAGKAAFATLDRRASREMGELIAPLTEDDRARLLSALERAHSLLRPSETKTPQPYLIRPLRAGDLGWVVWEHGVLYAQEYGFDATFEALVARIVADYGERNDHKRENAWIAEVDGEPVGCIFCVKKDAKTAQLRILIVDPKARGLGIGGRLIEECLRFAKSAGYSKMVLWTNSILHSARRLYQKAGFELIEEEKHHSFGASLVGQFWSRKL
jgi:DNA-binding MarR family transcriptional regulator/GNAT superfamily N-acetyltransferase